MRCAGQRWGLDTRGSGVYVLPPSEKDDTKFGVYQGTADAIYQNIDFIDEFNPGYVLILSGDHIYKMNYDKNARSTSPERRGSDRSRSPGSIGKKRHALES